jgi:hypothetical protein
MGLVGYVWAWLLNTVLANNTPVKARVKAVISDVVFFIVVSSVF